MGYGISKNSLKNKIGRDELFFYRHKKCEDIFQSGNTV